MVFSDIKDVIIIGGGPAGLHCAIRLHKADINVLLVAGSIKINFPKSNNVSNSSRSIVLDNARTALTSDLPIEPGIATSIRFENPYWIVTVGGKPLLARSVVLATGRREGLDRGLLAEVDDLEWHEDGGLVVDDDFRNAYSQLYIIGDLAAEYEPTVSTALGTADALARRLINQAASEDAGGMHQTHRLSA